MDRIDMSPRLARRLPVGRPAGPFSVLGRLPSHVIGYLFGFLDCSVITAYIVTTNANGAVSPANIELSSATGPVSGAIGAWHLATLCIKLGFLVLNYRNVRPPSVYAMIFVGFVGLITLLSMMFGGADDIRPYVQYGGFVGQFIVSLCLIRKDNLKYYLRAASVFIACTAALHGFLCLIHKMPSSLGRNYYFGQTHPNLGGEMGAIGALAAAGSWGVERDLRARFLACVIIAVCAVDAYFTQSRATYLTQAASLSLVFIVDANGRLYRNTVLYGLGALILVVAIYTISGMRNNLGDFVDSLFFLSDAHRGLGSGGSGRFALAQFGMELFEASPFVGYYPGYFYHIGYPGPHNFVIFGLAQFGISFVALAFCLLVQGGRLWMGNRPMGLVALSCLPLLMFNDRLINLNPYPFVFFIMLFAGQPTPAFRGWYVRQPSIVREASTAQ